MATAHDIHAGAMMLANGMGATPARTRSAWGSSIRASARAAARSWSHRGGPRLVGPDNGLLSLAWRALGGVTAAVEIDPAAVGVTDSSRRCSTARDVFAPAAAHLAAGAPIDRLGTPLDPAILETITLEDAESEPGKIHGSVVDVDRFGNIRLNARPADLDKAGFGSGSDGRGGDDGDVRSGSADRRLRRRPSRASTGCSSTRGTGWR